MASISFEDIKREKERQTVNYEKNKDKYGEISFKNTEVEKKLLKKAVGACESKVVANLTTDLNDIDEDILKRTIDSKFFNVSTMNAVSCVVDATFYIPTNSLGTLIRMKKWIRNLKKIGGSQQGVAIKGDLGTAEGAFVIKAPKNDHHNDDIIHEAVVSLYGTNKLRSTTPNFAYCFGTFSCASPIISDDEHVASWCIGNDKVTYMISENIYPSISYKKYILNASRDEFLSAYLQVLYALNEAHNQIDFTHYDLHYNNVLMRQYVDDEYFQIPYNTERGLEYLVSNKVATIIDFGFAHFKYEGKNYGVNLPGYSIYYNKSHVMHDAYKLLMFTAYALRNTDSPLLDDVSIILKFFSDDDLISVIEEHFENDRFSLPLTDSSIFELTSHIRSNFECNFISKSPGKFTTLQCTLDNKCPSVQSIFSDIGLLKKTHRQARDFIEYYEATNNSNEKVSIRYKTARKNFEDSIVDEYEEIEKSINRMLNMPRNSIEEYMFFLYTLVETLDNYNTLLLEIYIGDQVMKKYSEQPNFSEFVDILPNLGELVEIVKSTEDSMADIEYGEDYDHEKVSNRIYSIYNSLQNQNVIK